MVPHIATIILNFNRHELTSECVRSLRVAEGASHEMIIVDNGSSDNSVQILRREFPDITVLAQNQNVGFAAGSNVGIRYALANDAEFVLLLNNDTLVAPGFLSEMLAAIQIDSRVAAVCPKIYFAHAPEMLWYAGADFNLWTGTPLHRGWKTLDRGQFDQRLEITQATGCAMLVRCRALREVGLLDEQFWAYVEDLDWSVRFLKKGYRLAFAPRARVWHHCGATAVGTLGSGSQAVRQFLSTRNMILLARKHVSWFQIPTFSLSFLINHIAFYSLLRLWQLDFRALWAIYRGLVEGLRTALTPSHTQLVVTEDVRKRAREECEPIASAKVPRRMSSVR